MKLRAMIACAAAATACLSMASAASAATVTKTAPGPGGAIPALPTTFATTFTASGVAGKVIDVNVAINGISHTFPEDIEASLTGPNGASVLLMSDAGSEQDATGINLLFDDSAAAKLPFDPPGPGGPVILGGTYQPTNYVGPQSPPDPDLTSTVPTLAGLTGGSPNGNWVLRLSDDFSLEDDGSYSGSVLTITSQFKKKKCKKKKGKKGAVAAKKCKKKKQNKMVLSVR